MAKLITQKAQPAITIADRLEFGFVTVDELCALARRSRTGIYQDAKAGLLEIAKVGRSSRIHGPVAKAYINRYRYTVTPQHHYVLKTDKHDEKETSLPRSRRARSASWAPRPWRPPSC